MNRKKVQISVAAGRAEADLVLKNVQFVNVFTESLELADVAVKDGYIVGIGSYSGKVEEDLTGSILAPGFIDGHMHLESSLVRPGEYERAVLPRGTTAVVADPHEIANVAGTEGLKYMMSCTNKLYMKVYYTLPSCVPSSPLEESGMNLEAGKIEPYFTEKMVVGLAEVMNAPGVVSGDQDLLDKISAAQDARKCVDGHAPDLTGEELNAYITAGVHSDHECTNAKEAMEKLGRGQWIMIREGTAAKNMEALLPLCGSPWYQRCMFVTDDRHPEDLLYDGHMDAVIRKAVSLGVDPIKAIKMCTLNPAAYFGLNEYGAVAPGYKADFVVLSDLKNVKVLRTYINGRLVAKDGKVLKSVQRNVRIPKNIRHSFHMPHIREEMFVSDSMKKKLRVIGLKHFELLTDEIIVDVTEDQRKANGIDLGRDILKAAVLERHHQTGHIGVGFIQGYGLKKGAIATSVAHDSHNIIVAGTNESDMAVAAERIRQLEGGLVIACDGVVLEELPLPVAGLMSTLTVEETEERLRKLKKQAVKMGVSEDIDPFMTLAFVSLPVIPKLRLNGKGLISVEKQKVISVTVNH